MSQKKTAVFDHTGRIKTAHVQTAAAKNKITKKVTQGVPLIVVYWSIGLGFMGYVVSRFVLTPHPLHWASGAGGFLLGVIIGYIWFFTRGDVGLI